MPLLVAYLLISKFKHLDEPFYLEKIGSLYEESRYKEFGCIFNTLIFMIRRIIFGLAAVFCGDFPFL
jgi:hypothetical protein